MGEYSSFHYVRPEAQDSVMGEGFFTLCENYLRTRLSREEIFFFSNQSFQEKKLFFFSIKAWFSVYMRAGDEHESLKLIVWD